MRERPGLGPDDVLVAVTTLSFDIAGLELYLPLVVGGRLVIAPSQTASDPRLLSALLAESSATVMQATPTTWRMLLDSGWRGAPGLRALCGGEALPVALAEELVDCGIELWNMYGPTETTIWSTVARVHTGEPLTIGRPIGNTSLYILDSRLQPLPAGVAGELHIGGDGVARGYRNRPDLTEERFLANPFGEGRIYKTGDLARYRRDGSVEYLGRLDHQVKVRGFRIELGEIETLLARNDGVTRAVCVARDDGNGPELVAYIVPSGIPVSSAHLRRYLAEHLPPYMVPSAIVSLQEFPLTLNGKVDRKALPAPTRERQTEEEIVPPRTPLERRLAEIWKRVLGVSQISVTDNFFDLGASSIVAAQLFAEIEHELGGTLPLGAVFRAPTIEALANLIESGRRRLALDVARADPAAGHAAADLLRARGRRDDPSSGAARAPARARPAAVRAAVPRAVRRRIAAADRRGDGDALPLRDPPGSAVGPLCVRRLLLRRDRRVRDGPAHARRGRGGDAWSRSFNGPSPRGSSAGAGSGTSRRSAARARRGRARHARRRCAAPSASRSGSAVRSSTTRVGAFGACRRAWRLARGRPLPEALREEYFLRIHGQAERAYEPAPYPGRHAHVLRRRALRGPGDGVGRVRLGGVEPFAVPGDHTNNRQVMMEPHVEFVARPARRVPRRMPTRRANGGGR